MQKCWVFCVHPITIGPIENKQPAKKQQAKLLTILFYLPFLLFLVCYFDSKIRPIRSIRLLYFANKMFSCILALLHKFFFSIFRFLLLFFLPFSLVFDKNFLLFGDEKICICQNHTWHLAHESTVCFPSFICFVFWINIILT